jgi:phosphoglycerate kinase
MVNFLNRKTLHDVNLKNQTVIVRLDFNVPIKQGVIQDPKRIVATLPTLNYLLEHNCKIIILSHLSRIKTLEDINSGTKSLAPVAKKLQELLPSNDVMFCPASVGSEVLKQVQTLQPRQILLLENTRYNDVTLQNEVVKLESKCDLELGKF